MPQRCFREVPHESSGRRSAELPIFDAHVHYSHDAWEVLPPGDAIATLPEVVKHYSELSSDRLHSDGEAILKALRLSERGMEDLLAFLESLQDGSAGYQRRPFPEDCR
jgi:hypothetical protein